MIGSDSPQIMRKGIIDVLPQHLVEFIIDKFDEGDAKAALCALRLVSKSFNTLVSSYKGSVSIVTRKHDTLLSLRRSLPSLSNMSISIFGVSRRLRGLQHLSQYSRLHRIKLTSSGFRESFVSLSDLPSILRELELDNIRFSCADLHDIKCIGVTCLSIRSRWKTNSPADLCQLLKHVPALKVPLTLLYFYNPAICLSCKYIGTITESSSNLQELCTQQPSRSKASYNDSSSFLRQVSAPIISATLDIVSLMARLANAQIRFSPFLNQSSM